MDSRVNNRSDSADKKRHTRGPNNSTHKAFTIALLNALPAKPLTLRLAYDLNMNRVDSTVNTMDCKGLS